MRRFSSFVRTVFGVAARMVAVVAMVMLPSCNNSNNRGDDTEIIVDGTYDSVSEVNFVQPAVSDSGSEIIVDEKLLDEGNKIINATPSSSAKSGISGTDSHSYGRGYNEGYNAGFDDGEYDAVSGNGFGSNYDDSSHGYYRNSSDYEAGYEDGYHDGYSSVRYDYEEDEFGKW